MPNNIDPQLATQEKDPIVESFESSMRVGRLDVVNNLNAEFMTEEEALSSKPKRYGRLDEVMKEEKKDPKNHTIIGPTWYGWGWEDEQDKEVEPNIIKIDKESSLGKAITSYGEWTETNFGEFLTSEKTAETTQAVAGLILIGSMGIDAIRMVAQTPQAQLMFHRVASSPLMTRILGRKVSAKEMGSIFRKAQSGQKPMTKKQRAVWDKFQSATKNIRAIDAIKYGIRISPSRGAEIVYPRNLRLPSPDKDTVLFYSGMPIKGPDGGDVNKIANLGAAAKQAFGSQGVAWLVSQARFYETKEAFFKELKLDNMDKKNEKLMTGIYNMVKVTRNLKQAEGLMKPMNKTQLKRAITEQTGLNQNSKEMLKMMKEKYAPQIKALKLEEEVSKKLSIPLKASKIRPIVSSSTGQYYADEKVKKITEKQALKTGLRKEAKAARKASQVTKRNVKETMSLMKKIKAKPVEGMSYQSRAQLKDLKKELKGTRTLQGLRDLNDKIQKIKDAGKEAFKGNIEKKNALHELQSDILIETVKGTGEIPKKPITRATRKEQAKTLPKAIRLATLTPTRFFDKMDGGAQFVGPHNKVFYDSVNSAVHEEFKMATQRTEEFYKFIKENGIKPDYFVKTKEYGGSEFTREEMIGVYNALKNEERSMALFYGTNVTPTIAQQIINDLSDTDKAIGDFIVQGYENHYDRLNKAFVEYTDGKHELGKAEGYTPIKRITHIYEPTDTEIAKEMVERKGLRAAYANRDFTKPRANIPKEYQTPIRLDDVSIYLESIAKQEHFISHGNLVKQLQRIIGNPDYQKAIVSNPKLGQPYIDEIQSYINRVANVNIYKTYDSITKAVATIRGNIATVYLSWNAVTMAKQFPSIALYMGKVQTQELFAAFNDLTKDYDNVVQFVHSKSSQMKTRQIERELEEMKNTNPEAYKRIVDKIGKKGFEGIYMVDRYVTHGGWLAAYRQSLTTMSDVDAARHADKIVFMTQPAAGAKDIASIYATNEFLNSLLQFSNQLNKVYNNLTYDIPTSAKGGRYKDAMAGLLGVGISSYLIWSITHARFPKDADELKEALTESAISSIPIAGPLYVSQKKGFEGSSPIQQAITDPIKAAIAVTKEYDNWEDEDKAKAKTVEAMIKAVAIAKKIPYAQARRTIMGIKDLYTGKTSDIRRLIWSEFNLKEEEFTVR